MIFKREISPVPSRFDSIERCEKPRQSDLAGDPIDTEAETPHADPLVAHTLRHGERGQAARGSDDAGRDVAEYASGRVRDLFLAALDEADPRRMAEIARHLVTCGNPLPSVTCIALGLPAGSSYGAAARAVIAGTAAGR